MLVQCGDHANLVVWLYGIVGGIRMGVVSVVQMEEEKEEVVVEIIFREGVLRADRSTFLVVCLW